IDPCSTSGTVSLTDSSIQFHVGSTQYVVNVPNAVVTYSSSATQATTSFDAATNTWQTTVPTNYSHDVFLVGAVFSVPANLPGNVDPVNWCGNFDSSDPGLGLHGKWAAAVYPQFSTDLNPLAVKPIDGRTMNPYPNPDQAGTPEAFKQFVTAGARGPG